MGCVSHRLSMIRRSDHHLMCNEIDIESKIQVYLITDHLILINVVLDCDFMAIL